MNVVPLCISLVVLLAGCHPSASLPTTTTAKSDWLTLDDPQDRFRLKYPPTWTITRDVANVAHYSRVVAALNSAGKEHFIVHELWTGPNEMELSPAIIARQLPSGTAYIDLSWFDGPSAETAPDMPGNDLTEPMKSAETNTSDGIESKRVRFNKYGKTWAVTVYFHLPVNAMAHDEVDKILASLRLN